MALITYDGSAKDHDTIPQVLKRGKDGKSIPRKVVRPAKLKYSPVEAFNLRGMMFPAGQKLRCDDKSLVMKAITMDCFDVEVLQGEPVSYEREFMDWALANGRARLSEKGIRDVSGREAKKAQEASDNRHQTSDDLDTMKRTELMRLAASRGVNVKPTMKKGDLVDAIRAANAQLAAEDDGLEDADDLDEGGMEFDEDMDFDSLQDAG